MSFRGFYGVFKKFKEVSKEFQFLHLGGFKEFQEVSKRFFGVSKKFQRVSKNFQEVSKEFKEVSRSFRGFRIVTLGIFELYGLTDLLTEPLTEMLSNLKIFGEYQHLNSYYQTNSARKTIQIKFLVV